MESLSCRIEYKNPASGKFCNLSLLQDRYIVLFGNTAIRTWHKHDINCNIDHHLYINILGMIYIPHEKNTLLLLSSSRRKTSLEQFVINSHRQVFSAQHRTAKSKQQGQHHLQAACLQWRHHCGVVRGRHAAAIYHGFGNEAFSSLDHLLWIVTVSYCVSRCYSDSVITFEAQIMQHEFIA